MQIPEPLDTPEFRGAWRDWIAHRAELRKPIKETQSRQMLADMAAWGPSRSVAAIRHTIGKGWQGLREPDVPPTGFATNGHHPELQRPRPSPPDDFTGELADVRAVIAWFRANASRLEIFNEFRPEVRVIACALRSKDRREFLELVRRKAAGSDGREWSELSEAEISEANRQRAAALKIQPAGPDSVKSLERLRLQPAEATGYAN